MNEKQGLGESPMIDWSIADTLADQPHIIIDPVPWWRLLKILRERDIINIYKVNLKYRRGILEAQMRYLDELQKLFEQMPQNQ